MDYQKFSGIKSISPVLKVEKTIEAMSAAAIKFAQQFEENSTFKIDVKRADKNFRIGYVLNYNVNWVVPY
ncbi:hypothetical protein ACVPOS_14295 [Staphylococcus aureus]